jgi:hypothetical protein
MLQILSTSNETSTGAELVQNGNFSEVGFDLVTNGDFSAAGINLVSNPNFTDGVEKIVDGDFPYPNTAWSLNTGVTVPSAGILDFDGTGGAYASQAILTSGNSYKVTIEVADASLTDTLVVFLGATNTILESVVAADTTIVLYGVAGGVNNRVYVGSWEGTITSVSVKELGADWTVEGSDPDSVSFGENGLTIVQSTDLGTDNRAYQLNVTEDSKSYKVTYTIHSAQYTASNSVKYYDGDSYVNLPEQGVGTHTFYYTREGTNDIWIFNLATPTTSATDFVTISSISVQELGEGWAVQDGWSIGEDKAICDGSTNNSIYQALSLPVGNIKVTFRVEDFTSGQLNLWLNLPAFTNPLLVDANGDYEVYVTTTSGANNIYFFSVAFIGSVTNITIQQLDPNGYWTIGTGWSIGDTKAISTVTGSNSDITQSILTAGKTYRTVYEIVDYTAGTAQAVVTGSDGADAVALGTFTEDLTTTGTDFSIRSKLGTFDGAVSSVSVKLLGTYDDQSIYVTAADVQTIAQASVYYLVELTSMGSKNSLYFLPSSVVPNNGRYTKLNFTVISKDALPQPTVGIISFYDSVGGFDTYPMGFYEFRIYEQTSSTNLDPLLATGLLEKGFAFVRDFSGNMQELTDGFKEYNPTLTQYVYSK